MGIDYLSSWAVCSANGCQYTPQNTHEYLRKSSKNEAKLDGSVSKIQQVQILKTYKQVQILKT